MTDPIAEEQSGPGWLPHPAGGHRVVEFAHDQLPVGVPACLSGRPLTAADRRVIGDNLSGFFTVLSGWAGGTAEPGADGEGVGHETETG